MPRFSIRPQVVYASRARSVGRTVDGRTVEKGEWVVEFPDGTDRVVPDAEFRRLYVALDLNAERELED